LLLVGGVHGGWEVNTVGLMNELRAHFAETPTDVLPGITVMIIPAMNPDGVAAGASLEGRFNANGVDLNRNWACGWQPQAEWREGPVDPGSSPFSEPETRAVAAFIERVQPGAALFYHSAADGVFAGDCPQRGTGEWRSGKLAAVYGEAANYSFGEAFSAYPVTGTAPSWADGLGIPAADVELSSARDTQFVRNLRGVMAAQCWLLANEPCG
jgi:predicted deacylase